jgi:hypothetical protein
MAAKKVSSKVGKKLARILGKVKVKQSAFSTKEEVRNLYYALQGAWTALERMEKETQPVDGYYFSVKDTKAYAKTIREFQQELYKFYNTVWQGEPEEEEGDD